MSEKINLSEFLSDTMCVSVYMNRYVSMTKHVSPNETMSKSMTMWMRKSMTMWNSARVSMIMSMTLIMSPNEV